MKKQKEMIIVISILVISAIFIKLSFFSIVPTDGLTNEWTFEEGYTDTVGNLDGFLFGSGFIEYDSKIESKVSRGYNAIIRVGSTSDFSDLCDNGCSFSIWANPESQLYLPGYMFNRDGFFYISTGSDGNTNFYLSQGGGISCDVNSITPIPIGEWSHLVGIWNPSLSKLSLYLNGVPKETICSFDSIDKIAWETPIQTYLSSKSPLDDYWRGMLDDIRFYNRPLLDFEVQELFTGIEYIHPPLPLEKKVNVNLGDSSKIRRVCYFKEGNTCGAEVRLIELPCNFIRLEDCQNALANPKTITLFEKIFGGILW